MLERGEWASTSAADIVLQVLQKRSFVNPRGFSAVVVAMIGDAGNDRMVGGTPMLYGLLAGARRLSTTTIVLVELMGQGQAVVEVEESVLWPSVAVSVEWENKERHPLQK